MNKPEYISTPDWNILKHKYQNNEEYLTTKLNEGYPVQYLIGDVEFLNTTIKVNESVLIPRFETEYLVDEVIKYAKKQNKKLNILELGTGSGCISIALKKNLDCDITAIDISPDAIRTAVDNSILNNTKINFLTQDMLKPLKEKYDLIVSNPPYIPYDGFVEEKVKKYEPNIALFAKDNGIYYYKKIIEIHLNNLNKPSLIAFEIGDNEKNLLTEFLNNYPNLRYEFKNDLQGLSRYLFIYNE